MDDAYSRARLRALAEFSHTFEAPHFSFGSWVEPPPRFGAAPAAPYFKFAPEAESFLDTLHRDSWVLRGFDWVAWIETEEGERLRNHPEHLMSATPDQLARLFTALVRQERFSEGSLNDAFESGLLPLAARRAGVLLRDLERAS